MNEHDTQIAIKRDYLVVKHNDIIQKSRFQMKLQEQKTIAYICSMIKPSQLPDGTEVLQELEYDFSISEYCDICGIEKDGRTYKEIKKILFDLSRKDIEVRTSDGADTIIRWIERPFIYKNSGTIKIKLDALMVPYLFHLQSNFTQYQLIYILAMKSAYSIRLYEILKSWSYQRGKQFTVEDLKDHLNATTYTRYYDFKKRVLEPALKEINKLSDLTVKAIPIVGKNRKVEKIKFVVIVKDRDDAIEAQYATSDILECKHL